MTTPYDDFANQRWHNFMTTNKTQRIDIDSKSIHAFARSFAVSDFVYQNCLRYPLLIGALAADNGLFDDTAAADCGSRLNRMLQTGQTDYISPQVENLRDLQNQGEQAGRPVLAQHLRRFRLREMVRIAVRDLGGMVDTITTMHDLSRLAQTCVQTALNVLYGWQCRKMGAPAENQQGLPQQLIVLGMGKLGGDELNFSSDIDLIFAYPGSGQTRGNKRPVSHEAFFVSLARDLLKVIGENTADGFVFRTDADLRPYGKSGPMAMSFDAMEEYYQRQGREWERYALIKAAVIAGDATDGNRLLRRLRPFVYRRYLDYGVFDSLRDMKQSIATEVRRKGMANNIKLGRGGIREIEFFGQMFQLLRGGVHPDLQCRSILDVLAVLARQKLTPAAVTDELSQAYLFWRKLENRLQMAADQQIHQLPSGPDACQRLAWAMDALNWPTLAVRIEQNRNRVHTHFKRLLHVETPDKTSQSIPDTQDALQRVWQHLDNDAQLVHAGFTRTDDVVNLLRNFQQDSATRALSRNGRRKLDRLMPLILAAAGKADGSTTALCRLLDLIKAIQQRTNYLSLLIEHPAVLTRLTQLADISPWIISFLSRHPVLLDELLDVRTLYHPPRRDALATEIDRRLEQAPPDDLEAQIETLCIFKQINVLRVAAADVGGRLPLMRISDHLSDIAEIVVSRVLQLSWRHLQARHGCPPGTDGARQSGFAIVAYGKLGGLELGYGSDIDLVFLHCAAPGETTRQDRPLENSQFYARLGQRIIHLLTAYTRAGRLYETDMRLRPSGNAGPLVSHIQAFADYYRQNAWTWEHQAIIRARAISGDPDLIQRFNRLRQEVIVHPRQPQTLQDEIVAMRQKLKTQMLDAVPDQFDLKQADGGMVDIEFLVQYLTLRHAAICANLAQWTDNVRLLQELAESGIIDALTAHRLRQAYLIYRATVHRLSLQEKPGLAPVARFAGLRRHVTQAWRQIMACKRASVNT